MTTPDSAVPRLRVRTRIVSHELSLTEQIPTSAGVSAWLHRTDGIVGWGEVVRRSAPRGRDRFIDAQQWWQRVCALAEVHDEVGLPGCGLIAFAGFGFAEDPGESWLNVPATILGRRGDQRWRTTVELIDGPVEVGDLPHAVRAPGRVEFGDADLPAQRYREVVEAGVARIRAGQAEKIVLARDLLAVAERDIDPRYLLERLVAQNDDCWTFCVGGLIGSTPELLLRRQGVRVDSRVLAGTGFPGRYWTGGAANGELFNSAKDRAEHGYAVRSVVEALAPFASALEVAREPAVLRLATLTHLASEVVGTLADDAPGILSIVDALHPTAAVGGTPTAAAVAAIAELETMDRGRYAGPVGWLDAAGNGEFGIALRCGQLDGRRLRLLAGCGVVAASDPEVEAAEAEAKFRAMRNALVGPVTRRQDTLSPYGRDERWAAMPDATDFPYLAKDLDRVRQLIASQVSMTDQRIHEPCGHLLRNAGRLFRPTLVLTSAYAFAPDEPANEGVIRAAVIMELLHVATLYHDDLCDEASTRRGEPTVNAVYGNTIALLCGDYLLACCTELLAGLGPDAMLLFGDTLKALCKGQFQETVSVGDPTRSESAYFESIAGKTAKLMASSAAFGAMQAGATQQQQKIMASYGHHLGLAFQVWDDLLDLWSAVDTGKPRFGDLRNGVYTLPLIYGLREEPDELGALLAERAELSDQDCADILTLLERTTSRSSCLAAAREHITSALGAIAELGEPAEVLTPRLVGVARDLMPEVEQLLTAVLAQEART